MNRVLLRLMIGDGERVVYGVEQSKEGRYWAEFRDRYNRLVFVAFRSATQSGMINKLGFFSNRRDALAAAHELVAKRRVSYESSEVDEAVVEQLGGSR